MTLEIGTGKDRFLAYWSDNYQEVTVGKKVGTITFRRKDYPLPFFFIRADSQKQAEEIGSKIKSLEDILKMGGCPL